MRLLSALFFVLLLTSCRPGAERAAQMQAQVDSLKKELDSTYKPGLGEFMSSIQLHHEKLWFAGQAQNWMLADFEMDEISELLEDIKKYAANRPEIKSLPMILPALDSVNNAILRKDPAMFKDAYMLLTNTCNNCHRATQHAFNVIKVPDVSPVSDQSFSLPK